MVALYLMDSRIVIGLWSIGGRILSGAIQDPRGGTTPTTGFAFVRAGAGKVEPDSRARGKHASRGVDVGRKPTPDDHKSFRF